MRRRADTPPNAATTPTTAPTPMPTTTATAILQCAAAILPMPKQPKQPMPKQPMPKQPKQPMPKQPMPTGRQSAAVVVSPRSVHA